MSEAFVNSLRELFPALTLKARDKDLIYLDSAATTLKPKPVIDVINQFYSFETANVHRGAHFLADQATTKFEKARTSIAQFLGAASSDEIVFTKGTTESINLIAATLGEMKIKEGDEILLTEMEHHANLVPWQMLAERKKAQLKFISVDANGELDAADFKRKLTSKTKILALTACSITLGTVNDIAFFATEAKKMGAYVVVDGAQYVTFAEVDVQKLNCDFFVFSSHKLFGPFGFGALYGRKEILETLPPYQGGGSMIANVDLDCSTYNVSPYRFEAGTPHVEGAIGTLAALDFYTGLNQGELKNHKEELTQYAQQSLEDLGFLTIYGAAKKRAPIFSFNLNGAHHSDVSQILDQQGIAVRAGHHCTQPLFKKLKVTGSVRASFSIYNTKSEVDALVRGLKKAKEMLT